MPQQFLHGAKANSTNNYSGLVGGHFTVGASPVTVTHLGYYASAFTDANKTNGILTLSHHVGIFSASGSVLYGSVLVPAGTNSAVNGYMWAPLNPALVLSNNTQYLLVAETFSGSDPWGDTYVVPDLNPYFASVCDATYSGNAWPNATANGLYAGQMYSAPNLAILALPAPSAFVQPASIAQVAGSSATLSAIVAGQAPLTPQWYQGGTLLAGQTNATLFFSSLDPTNAGNYYVVVTNTLTFVSATSTVASVTVYTSPVILGAVAPDLQQPAHFVCRSQCQRFAVRYGHPASLLSVVYQRRARHRGYQRELHPGQRPGGRSNHP